MNEQSETKSKAGELQCNKFHGFKKKLGGRNKGRKQQSADDDFFRGVGFSVCRDSPELYPKTVERLGLYVSTQSRIDLT